MLHTSNGPNRAALILVNSEGDTITWNGDCESAFNTLIHKLIEQPVKLSFPKWGEEMYVETDASGTGISAVLSQKDDQTGVLQATAHQLLLLSTQRFPEKLLSRQLEAWALVAATRKWELYLRGAGKVHLITDHNPLSWLRSQRDPRHTYARWLMELDEFPYEIKFRPGPE